MVQYIKCANKDILGVKTVKRKILLMTAAFLMLCCGASAEADVLGEVTGGWSSYMGAYTYFHNVQFTSDSVGKQTEH